MEHRLILGGEQYLPFARSCVTRLKKLGLPYANQSYEVDGVSIKVRIEPGHEYIRLEGGMTPAYLETGQLEPAPVGPDHPDRGKPAKWHFLDIPTDSPYLGLCDVVGKPEDVQLNDPALTESMDSLAIGYARDPDPVVDAQLKASTADLTVAKTLTVALFKPSLWSGLMRLFMQAQYGAKQTELHLEVSVSPVILNYIGKEGGRLQLGLWSHASPGIFSAELAGKPLGKFWLMNIRNPTGSEYVVTAYRIKFDKVGAYVRKQYLKRAKDGTLTPEVRVKLEAYMFANCTVDVANPESVGVFTGAPGAALAYGWKFNKTGSKASIVVHETLGTGAADLRWNASTIHVTFTHAFDEEAGVDTLALTSEVEVGGEWTDGWGSYNIFRPIEDVGSDQLEHFSLMVDRLSVKPAFAFTGVPVYGYYKDNVWTPTKMTRTIEAGPWPKRIQECSMPYPNPGIAPTTYPTFHHSARLAGEGYVYDTTEATESSTMDLDVGGSTFTGVSYYGPRWRVVQTVIGKGGFDGPASTVDFLVKQFGGLAFQVADTYGDPPGWGDPGPGTVAADYEAARCTYVTDTWTWTGWKFHAWALVIPAYDCEAVFVGTHEYDTADGAVARTELTELNRTYLIKCRGVIVQPYANYVGGWYADITAVSTVTDAAPPPELTAEIYCFTPFVPGTQGAYHASSSPLFIVDKNYPYYMAGMGALTSYGGRYAITEGLKSPASANYSHHFVGWA